MAKHQLPTELVREIFSHLPVKSLRRFSCLSKPISTLINGRDFIKYHHAQSLKSNVNASLLVFERDIGNSYASFDFDSLENPTILKYPMEKYVFSFEGAGCNGILCFVEPGRNVCLLNSATREHHVLPDLEPARRPGFYFFGFGYDSFSDDHKVVGFPQYSHDFQVMLYSLKQNAWRKVEQPFSFSVMNRPYESVFVSGRIHLNVLLFRAQWENVVLGFDLSTETYNEVPLPDALISSGPLRIERHMSVLGGCLCVVSDGRPQPVHVWVMKEYGIKASWVKLFSVLLDHLSLRVFAKVIPIAYSKNRDRVLLEITGLPQSRANPDSLFWYDLKEKKMSLVQTLKGKLPHSFHALATVESLVSLKDIGKGMNA